MSLVTQTTQAQRTMLSPHYSQQRQHRCPMMGNSSRIWIFLRAKITLSISLILGRLLKSMLLHAIRILGPVECPAFDSHHAEMTAINMRCNLTLSGVLILRKWTRKWTRERKWPLLLPEPMIPPFETVINHLWSPHHLLLLHPLSSSHPRFMLQLLKMHAVKLSLSLPVVISCCQNCPSFRASNTRSETNKDKSLFRPQLQQEKHISNVHRSRLVRHLHTVRMSSAFTYF